MICAALWFGSAVVGAHAGAQAVSRGSCEPQWLPTFGSYVVSPTPLALLVFDDGAGPALYAATAGGGMRLDGTHWTTLGTVNGVVRALAAFDDGSGPALYAGGDFQSADGVRVRGVAKWDGRAWRSLGPVTAAGAAS